MLSRRAAAGCIICEWKNILNMSVVAVIGLKITPSEEKKCTAGTKKRSFILPIHFCFLLLRCPIGEICCCSSVVEHFLGKEEVTSSSLVNSSRKEEVAMRCDLFFCCRAERCERMGFVFTTLSVESFPDAWAGNIYMPPRVYIPIPPCGQR